MTKKIIITILSDERTRWLVSDETLKGKIRCTSGAVIEGNTEGPRPAISIEIQNCIGEPVVAQ